MISFDYEIRVRYGEVDQMGFLYHANYVNYFDAARTEMIRSFGVSNFELESEGIMIPVLEVNVKYGKPAHYDDVLTIRTSIKEPARIKTTFHYQVLRGGECLTKGSVTVAFMNAKTKSACRPPIKLINAINDRLNENKE